jgi:hypothetical protein
MPLPDFATQWEYPFPKAGTHTIACYVQDNQGGERTVVQVIKVN